MSAKQIERGCLKGGKFPVCASLNAIYLPVDGSYSQYGAGNAEDLDLEILQERQIICTPQQIPQKHGKNTDLTLRKHDIVTGKKDFERQGAVEWAFSGPKEINKHWNFPKGKTTP